MWKKGIDYKISLIPKGNNQFRMIYKISGERKRELKALLPRLNEILVFNDKFHSNYAFTKGRNSVMNAHEHIGREYVISFDIENFFDTINRSHVSSLIEKSIINSCFIDGAPRQGLPTSPIISSIAFLKCDGEIIESLNSLKISYTYTRYADDITIGFDDQESIKKIKSIMPAVLKKHGFNINGKKTKTQSISNGRVIITGVAIDKNGVYPTRKTMKKIRAATHQGNEESLFGLYEWAQCKLPKVIKK